MPFKEKPRNVVGYFLRSWICIYLHGFYIWCPECLTKQGLSTPCCIYK